MTLAALASKWKTKHANAPSGWIDCLVRQIKSAALWEFPNSDWELLPHANSMRHYVPALMNVCKSPAKKKLFLDV